MEVGDGAGGSLRIGGQAEHASEHEACANECFYPVNGQELFHAYFEGIIRCSRRIYYLSSYVFSSKLMCFERVGIRP